MREILFRGKRYDNGNWVEGYLIHDETCNTHIPYIGYLFDGGHDIDVAEIILGTVGQFTGITDANGTKIFEGDIVECAREDEPLKVEWCEDTARFILSASTFCCDFDNYWGYEMEVIGNIHDNKEPLEG